MNDKASVVDGDYLVGLGSYDMTGPAADVNMMGYANLEQVTAGVHFRQRARAFIVAEGEEGARFAFVNLDAGMASQLVTIKVLERLKSRFGYVYNEENLAISGTHTHAGPGGYLQYVTYIITSLGFVKQSFDVIVTAIEQSIVQAHNNLRPGSIFINRGDVANAGINRSPSAYLFNPPEERARYPTNVDTEMTLVKFVDGKSGKSIGSFNWFATHGTSMSKNNKLVSGDNKGAAARFFEDWFRSSHQNSSTPPRAVAEKRTLEETASRIEATGGQPCDRTTSQRFKVRKTSDAEFVGAFCQSNVGDVSPNVLGAFCLDSGKPCDFNHSSCNGNDQLCVGRGPGYRDEILSTKIIGERQFEKSIDLFNSAQEILSGKVDYRHVYLNLTNIEVELQDNRVVKTCPAALGPGFAAGTTDGPGAFGFQQGDTQINEFWKRLRDFLKEPSQEQVDCQLPKTVLLDTGEMFEPYPWAPAILPIQILRIGKLVILSVPGEFTTMAGRRLREAVKDSLINNGNGEFSNDTIVVIAGLTNAYSQYIATFEEYKQQRYEAASTLYGPHTLSAYIQEFKKLATAMATGKPPTTDSPSPPDLSSVQISLLAAPAIDTTPPGRKFGDIEEDIFLPPKKGHFTTGERVSASFWSANPRNDLMTEGTFAVVEALLGERWVPAFDDDDFSLFFKWGIENTSFHGVASVEWEIPKEAISGVYRLRHFGAAKVGNSAYRYFTGASSAFAVSSS
ncbi:neutral ceramidase 2-like [Aristolochia californica]|uniref:neutral ceramidase 2-like n=1 Tax=Aristolochia californica TaxID=171875 RepID=UPI0035E16B95